MTPRTVDGSPLAEHRPATATDAAFLLALYADSRAPEFSGLPADQAVLLIRLQHEARSAGYVAAYPGSTDEILELDGQPVGRVLVDDSPVAVHVVDLAVLRDHRGRGLATRALERWAAHAHERGVPVTLTVLDDSPAVGLYRRLGFRTDGPAGSGRLRMTFDAHSLEKEAAR